MTVRVRIRGPTRSACCEPAWRRAKRRYTATTTVRYITTEYGYSDYDALNVSVEKRYSHNFSARGAYSLGYLTRHHGRPGRHTAAADVGRSASRRIRSDRRAPNRTHNFTLSGRVEIPKTTRRNGERHAASDERARRSRSRTTRWISIAIASTSHRCPRGRMSRSPAAGQYVMTGVESEGGRNGAGRSGIHAARHARRLPRETWRTPHAGHLLRNVQRRPIARTSRIRTAIGARRRSSCGWPVCTGGTGFPRQSQIGLRLGF